MRRALVDELHPVVEGDLAAAELIAGELLSNVARYTPGPFSAEVRWEGDRAVFVVHDRGENWTAPALPEEAPDDAQGGRGLRIVAALGGSIDIDRRPGEGCRVAVALPVRRRSRAHR